MTIHAAITNDDGRHIATLCGLYESDGAMFSSTSFDPHTTCEICKAIINRRNATEPAVGQVWLGPSKVLVIKVTPTQITFLTNQQRVMTWDAKNFKHRFTFTGDELDLGVLS